MIALFTDFGIDGPWIGQVEAVLHQHAPGVSVINLFSDLPLFDVEAAACLLPAYITHFPAGAVFLCVVDPGVGSQRPGVVVQADGRWFVGPNEGLFVQLVRQSHKVACWQLPDVVQASRSFHARDVFAPVAARLACDGRVTGEKIEIAVLDQPDWPDDLERIVYIDHFGNAITGMRACNIEPSTIVRVTGHTLRSAQIFSAVNVGEAFWYENSNGLVEIAVNKGRANEVLDLMVGTVIGV